MRLSDHFSKPCVPLLFSFAQEARALVDLGIDVISMEQGQMDFPTPANVIEAAKKFMDTGQILYTNVDGLPALKEAIQFKLKRDNALFYELDELYVGAGTSQVIFNALAVTLEPGDEVIVPVPAWTVFELGIRAHRGIPRYIETSFDTGFKITPNQLQSAITPQTKWFVLNSPSNPTGAIYSADELESLANVLRQHAHVAVLSDDLYEHQIYDERKFVNIVNVAPDLRDRILVINGVAKTYGMTGWRIGYGAGPAHLLLAMKWYQAPSTSSPCHISQIAAIEALNGPQRFLEERRQILQERRNIFVQAINECPGWSAKLSEGAFYVYASCEGLIGATTPKGVMLNNDIDVARYLMNEANVISVPGAAFGLSPFIRFSFGTSTDRVAEAGRRIMTATKSLLSVKQ